MKRFSKIKKGAEDFYTAEDDFWKISTFLGERARYARAYEKMGKKWYNCMIIVVLMYFNILLHHLGTFKMS